MMNHGYQVMLLASATNVNHGPVSGPADSSIDKDSDVVGVGLSVDHASWFSQFVARPLLTAIHRNRDISEIPLVNSTPCLLPTAMNHLAAFYDSSIYSSPAEAQTNVQNLIDQFGHMTTSSDGIIPRYRVRRYPNNLLYIEFNTNGYHVRDRLALQLAIFHLILINRAQSSCPPMWPG
jgi:hypothetical protein